MASAATTSLPDWADLLRVEEVARIRCARSTMSPAALAAVRSVLASLHTALDANARSLLDELSADAQPPRPIAHDQNVLRLRRMLAA
jgi:hypothetical protein